MGVSDEEADRAGREEIAHQTIWSPDINIVTPAMIDAGVKVLAQASSRYPLPNARDTVAAMYQAMFLARGQ